MYGAEDREGWIQVIRANIRAALAEKPRYLVWHVQESTPEEAFPGASAIPMKKFWQRRQSSISLSAI